MTDTKNSEMQKLGAGLKRARVTDEPAFDDFDTLKQVLDQLPEGVVVWEGSTIRYVNAAALSLARYDGEFEAFAPDTLHNWVHADDRPRVLAYYYDCVRHEPRSDAVQYRLLRTDGTTCLVESRVKPMSIGLRNRVLFTVHEVAEVPTASDGSISASEKTFQSVFRLVPDMMILADLHSYKIIDVNPAYLNLFGHMRDDIIGKPLDEIRIWADPTFFPRFSQEFKMTASMRDLPTTLATRGGITRQFKMFVQKMEYGAEPVILLMGRDVTDDLVQVRELERGRETAEFANRAKSEFLANMSHELRTPLNAILGFAEIIRDEMLGPVGHDRYKEYADDIHQSGAHLLSIINDILDLSKVEAGRLDSHFVWSDPVAPLEMCLSLVTRRAKEGDLQIEFRALEGYELEADDRLVKQIALNLLSNAIKFTRPGGRVTLALDLTSDAGMCLSVEDTGIGMTPEEVKIAKRPFGQVDSSLSRANQGSGLGLPLVATFADKLDGSFQVTSTPGVGTKVSVSFPAHRVRQRAKIGLHPSDTLL